MILRPGMVVLGPSSGGYAPDATEPELLRVVSIGGVQGCFVESLTYGNSREFPLEWDWVVNAGNLSRVLDAATGRGGAFREDSLKIGNVDLFVFPPEIPERASPPEEGFDLEDGHLPWLLGSKISLGLGLTALVVSLAAIVIATVPK